MVVCGQVQLDLLVEFIAIDDICRHNRRHQTSPGGIIDQRFADMIPVGADHDVVNQAALEAVLDPDIE